MISGGSMSYSVVMKVIKVTETDFRVDVKSPSDDQQKLCCYLQMKQQLTNTLECFFRKQIKSNDEKSSHVARHLKGGLWLNLVFKLNFRVWCSHFKTRCKRWRIIDGFLFDILHLSQWLRCFLFVRLCDAEKKSKNYKGR